MIAELEIIKATIGILVSRARTSEGKTVTARVLGGMATNHKRDVPMSVPDGQAGCVMFRRHVACPSGDAVRRSNWDRTKSRLGLRTYTASSDSRWLGKRVPAMALVDLELGGCP